MEAQKGKVIRSNYTEQQSKKQKPAFGCLDQPAILKLTMSTTQPSSPKGPLPLVPISVSDATFHQQQHKLQT